MLLEFKHHIKTMNDCQMSDLATFTVTHAHFCPFPGPETVVIIIFKIEKLQQCFHLVSHSAQKVQCPNDTSENLPLISSATPEDQLPS